MSTKIMALCWPIQINPTAKSVLISLADNANDEGYCWPSIKTIAERTCLSSRSVIRAIEALEEVGLLVADRSNGRHSKYWIKPKPVTDSHRCQSVTSDRESPNQCHSVTAPVTESHTNHKEPSRTVNKDRGSSRGSRFTLSELPDDWLTFARKEKPEIDPRWMFDKFRDYWIGVSGSKGVKLDWFATWRNFCRTERGPTNKPKLSPAEQRRQAYIEANYGPQTATIDMDSGAISETGCAVWPPEDGNRLGVD